MDKFATEVVLRFRDIDGEHEIKTCYGDIYKIVNVFMDTPDCWSWLMMSGVWTLIVVPSMK